MGVGSMHISDTENDSLLLLTLGLDVADDDFTKASNAISALKNKLSDVTSSFSVGDFVDGLNKAVQALRAAVNVWNSLENHAISFSTSQSGLQSGLTSAEKSTLYYRLQADKVAKNAGVTSTSVENTIDAIRLQQGTSEWQGSPLSTSQAVAIQRAGMTLGRQDAQGSALSDLLTKAPAKDVYLLIGDLYAELLRKAKEALSKGDKTAANAYMQQASLLPFLTAADQNYISREVDLNPDYARSGNPEAKFFYEKAYTVGNKGDRLKELAAEAETYQSAFAKIRAELKQTTDYVGTVLYDKGGNLILGLGKAFNLGVKAITGQQNAGSLSGTSLFDSVVKVKGWDSKNHKKSVQALTGFDSTGTESLSDLTAEMQAHLAMARQAVSPILGEIDLYEAYKMSQSNYTDQVNEFMREYQQQLVKHLGITDKQAYALLNNPNSTYYMPIKDTGLVGAYSKAYKLGLYENFEYGPENSRVVTRENEQGYLQAMNTVFSVSHEYMRKLFPNIPEGEVTSKVVEKNGKSILEVHIVDDKTHNEEVLELDANTLASITMRN